MINFLLVFVHMPVIAEIYQYTNGGGKKIYVDRLSQVPAKYRSQLKTRNPSVTQVSEQQLRLYQLENKLHAKRITTRNTISSLTAKTADFTTDVAIADNQVIVPVSILYAGKKQTLNLLLDTGASSTVIHTTRLKSFNLKSQKLRYAQVAGGGLIKSWEIQLNKISFGPYQYSSKNVLVIEHKGEAAFDGLLGMDLLPRNDYQIDFYANKIIWDKLGLFQVQQKINRLKLELN